MRTVDKPVHYWHLYRKEGIRAALKEWMRFPRKLIPTKAGWVFFIFMLVIIVFAYTTNNNLLFLLFSSMMSIMIVSGMLSEASIGKIYVTRIFPDEIYVNRPFIVNHFFRNKAKLVSAFAFYLEDKFLYHNNRGPLVVFLKKGNESKIKAKALVKKRGLHTLPEYKVVTEYPFMLFTKSRRINGGEKIVVFPEVKEVFLPFEQLFGAGQNGERESEEEGDNFAYLREYRKGEPLRKIDWKKSAGKDDLYLKEFVSPQAMKVAVVFLRKNNEYYEEGLSMAASIIVLLNKKGIPFNLFAGEKHLKGFSTGHDRLTRAMTMLALYNGEKCDSPTTNERVIEVYADGSYEII